MVPFSHVVGIFKIILSAMTFDSLRSPGLSMISDQDSKVLDFTLVIVSVRLRRGETQLSSAFIRLRLCM